MTTPCPVPELPVAGCLVPAATATPTPSASSSPAATAAPSQSQTPAPTPAQTSTVASVSAPAASSGPVPVPVTQAVPPVATASPVALAPEATVQAVTLPTAPSEAAGLAPLSGVVASSFALVVFGLLGAALLASFLSGLRPAVTRSPSYGGTVNNRRTRLWTGLGVLALAAVVGGVGWYRVSGEPLLNRQVPFLASTGIAVVVLAVLGAALIIAEQLRSDQDRIGDLEEAVRSLTEALAPSIEQPARGRKSGALLK